MILRDRFTMHPVRKQAAAQPECPVYVHCSRCFSEKRCGANFIQVRMVNCSERLICDVYLRIEGFDRNANRTFVRNEIVLANCNALPHTIFGEDRIVSLGSDHAASVQITVERVCFADGMIWRKLPSHKLVSTATWQTCTCGMKNPPQATSCKLCSRSFVKKEAPKIVEKAEPFIPFVPIKAEAPPPVVIERPSPIVRTQPYFIDPPMPMPMPEGVPTASRAWKVSLILFLLLTTALIAGVILFADFKNFI